LVQPLHFKRLPRLFTLQNPLAVSKLGCPCTYRTIAHRDGRRESFLDLRLPGRTFSIPMFVHFIGQPVGNTPAITISQNATFRFIRLGL
jgi:hypothetical protein